MQNLPVLPQSQRVSHPVKQNTSMVPVVVAGEVKLHIRLDSHFYERGYTEDRRNLTEHMCGQ